MKKLMLILIVAAAVVLGLSNTTADSTVTQRSINAEAQYEADKAELGETAAWFLRNRL